MQRLLVTATNLLAAGALLLGIAQAQQTPAAQTQPAPAAKAPATAAPKTAKAPTAKTTATPGAKAAVAPLLKTQKEKFSYALGMNLGNGLGANLRKQSVEFDPALLAQGLKDALVGGKTRLTPEEAQAILKEVQMDVQKKQAEKAKAEGEANKKKGDAYLAANKTKEGVVTLPSGLEYKILKVGTGPKPTASDTVVCNYRGTLINGTEFDSSYKRGQPATFPVGGVIKGWTEALQLMPVGSKWQLFIPSGLAYGERGAGADIGPNATLIFEVELLSIQDKAKSGDQTPAEPEVEDKKPKTEKKPEAEKKPDADKKPETEKKPESDKK